jgi:hypothetical protein
MRLLEESYGDIRIFSERPYGYKRYIVTWGGPEGRETMYSSIWYSLDKVKHLVEKEIESRPV